MGGKRKKKVSLKDCKNALKMYIETGNSHFLDEICKGAVRGRDLDRFRSLDEWAKWLAWASVLLDEKDYLTAAVHALSHAPHLSATDYGTARQRDLGQLWTDAIRGYLGEIAFVKWLNLRFNIRATLDYRLGSLEEFLPSDIKEINGRKPKLNISIKTTKLQGIWLDVPFNQVEHSDIFVLVRIGITRDHFLAFLKSMSIIRDKMLAKALELGVISQQEHDEIWNSISNIPNSLSIPAYVVGFLDKREIKDKLEKERILTVDGKIGGRDKVRLVVNKFLGYWHPSDEELKRILLTKYWNSHPLASKGAEDLSVEFEGIGNFAGAKHFIANSGELKRMPDEWEALIREI